MLPKLETAGINVKVIAAISGELFDRQPEYSLTSDWDNQWLTTGGWSPT